VPSKEVTIKPVTRIEGAMQVTIDLDAAGNVAGTRANVQEFRGFERFLCGRSVDRMPILTPRICGVCPVPHHLAAVKAIEDGLGVTPPETAQLLRELMLVSEHVSDHMLHMFVLAGPDLLLPDLDPRERGLPTLYAHYPDVVRQVFEIRNVTQSLISALGVQAVHPATGVPGGMMIRLSAQQRDRYLTGVRLAKNAILKFHDKVWWPRAKAVAQQYSDLGALETHFFGLVRDDAMTLYDGTPRIVGPGYEPVREFAPQDYTSELGEISCDTSYAKLAYLRESGNGTDLVRTGPVGRLNVAQRAGTPHADAFLAEFRSLFGRVAQQTPALDLARYIDTVYSIERAEEILEDDRIIGRETRVAAPPAAGEGVGMVEAPRGVLIHHYRWDDNGLVTMANIITPTNANAYAIDKSLQSVAERSIHAGAVDQAQLEHEIGLVIRAYDPCLSCATHVLADEPGLTIAIVDAAGNRRVL
jgi:F420-non-reducing hydrogenase large subunit